MPFDGAIEDEIMGEESGIIEGGADPEGQEEWLSEGILTDDDYNPVVSTECPINCIFIKGADSIYK